MDTTLDSSLTSPPLRKSAQGSLPVNVDFRLTIIRVYDISTTNLSAKIRFGVVFYWTDPRLVGYQRFVLPPDLWGPTLRIMNTMGPVECDYEQFNCTNRNEGRLKRIVNFEATVAMPMALTEFPFDVQQLTADLTSISHWRQHDLTRGGSASHGQTYTLSPVSRPTEGVFLAVLWGGQVNEWGLHSYDVKLRSTLNKAAGFSATSINLSFHVVRQYQPYLYNIFGPCAILSVSAFCLQLIPINTEQALSSRIQCAFTMFLAAFALLYVMSDFVPKVSHSTFCEIAIGLALATFLWLAFESWVVYTLLERNGFKGSLSSGAAEAWEYLFGFTGLAMFLFWQVYFFLPPYWKQQERVRVLSRANGDGVFFLSPGNIEIRGTINSDSGNQHKNLLKGALRKPGTQELGSQLSETEIPCKMGQFCQDGGCKYFHPNCKHGSRCNNQSCMCAHPPSRRSNRSRPLLAEQQQQQQQGGEEGGQGSTICEEGVAEEEKSQSEDYEAVHRTSPGVSLKGAAMHSIAAMKLGRNTVTTLRQSQGNIEIELSDEVINGTSM